MLNKSLEIQLNNKCLQEHRAVLWSHNLGSSRYFETLLWNIPVEMKSGSDSGAKYHLILIKIICKYIVGILKEVQNLLTSLEADNPKLLEAGEPQWRESSGFSLKQLSKHLLSHFLEHFLCGRHISARHSSQYTHGLGLLKKEKNPTCPQEGKFKRKF